MNYLRIIGAALVLALASCATPYAEHTARGGYQETQINQNTYRVSFSGNGLTSGDMVWNYWIYRCAELTRAKGYDLMLAVADTKRTGSLDSGMKFVPAQFDGSEGGQMVKTRGGGRATTTTYSYTTITTYYKVALVRMFSASDVLAPRPALRAQTILDMLKPYVDSAGKVAAPSRAEILGRALVKSPPGFGAPTL